MSLIKLPVYIQVFVKFAFILIVSRYHLTILSLHYIFFIRLPPGASPCGLTDWAAWASTRCRIWPSNYLSKFSSRISKPQCMRIKLQSIFLIISQYIMVYNRFRTLKSLARTIDWHALTDSATIAGFHNILLRKNKCQQDWKNVISCFVENLQRSRGLTQMNNIPI